MQASRSQELVDKYVSTKAAQERETNAKVAALLNSKKAKLREMQARAVDELAQIVGQAVRAGRGSQQGACHLCG